MTNEELSLKTKTELAKALKSAMSKKPLHKITVSELADACNINRKTFYYHFQDIFELLKWMFEQETFSVIGEFDLITDTENAIRYIVDYLEINKPILLNAYNSIDYEGVKRFFHRDFRIVMEGVIKECENLLGVNVDKDFGDFICDFYCEATVGMAVEWLNGRLSQDKETIIQNMLLILKVSIPEIIQKKENGEGGI